MYIYLYLCDIQYVCDICDMCIYMFVYCIFTFFRKKIQKCNNFLMCKTKKDFKLAYKF